MDSLGTIDHDVVISLPTVEDEKEIELNAKDAEWETRIKFAGGLFGMGKSSDGLDAVVGPFLRGGAIFAVLIWIVLTVAVYVLAPPESFERLEGAERNAEVIVLTLLLCTNGSQIMQLVIRDKSLTFINTGIMVGSITVQAIAICTNLLLIFFPTPVVIDPVTGIRSHLVRWAEWIALAFLMTFLQEGIDLPLQGRLGPIFGWLHGIAIALSTSCGMILAHCPDWTTWLTVFGIAWALFCSLFIRLFQRYQRLSKMSPGVTVDERESYDRARFSFKSIAVCTLMWTSLAASWSVIALMHPYAAPDSVFKIDSLVLVTQCIFEATSKVLYSGVLLQIHNVLFDNASRTMRRLEELRSFMSAIWETSSDVMVWCSQSQDRVIGIVSPAFFNIDESLAYDSLTESRHSDIDRSTSTLLIEVNPVDGSHRTFKVYLGTPVTREAAKELICAAPREYNKAASAHNLSSREKNIAVVADLLREAYESKAREVIVIKDLYGSTKTKKEITLRCEAKITKLESSSRLIFLRDVSERFQRFEAEKKLIEEMTARNKDTEANRFTSHEVKNGILAAISLLDSMKGTQRARSSIQSEQSLSRMDSTARLDSDRSLSTDPTYDDSIGELDNTLKDILDTIADHAMSREVVYEEYAIRKERVVVPEVLSNIRRMASSNHSRFSLLTTPEEFPMLGMDPRLLRYIYQNALSNACRYGQSGGDVRTSLRYDNTKKEFHMEVVNAPGPGHEKLLDMIPGDIRSLVFSPGKSLHLMYAEEEEVTIANSSGDGAWIMQKCARILKGDVDIRFEKDRTVFSFWCPARSFAISKVKADSENAIAFTLPENTWGIVIDDSGIQRKLMGRFLKTAGIQKDRCVIVGKDAKEIYGFTSLVVDLVKANPNDKVLIIADENLEVVEGPALQGTVSGSLCIQKILERLEPAQSSRVLALVRSANDSAKDIERYKIRAHGYLLKAPIDKMGVLNTIKPWWLRRFQSAGRRSGSLLPSCPMLTRSDSWTSCESEGYDPFHDIKHALELVDALCKTSAKESLRKRWRSIQDRLLALKGDLKTVIPYSKGEQSGVDLASVIKAIDELRANEFPENLQGSWATLKSRITVVVEEQATGS
jgi:signal transduction histidine kinase